MIDFIALLVVLLLYWYYIRTRTMSLLKRCGIPGPKPNLILGNVLQMANMSVVDYQKHLLQTYGRVVGYYIGTQPNILVSDKELIKCIQSSDFKTFPDRPIKDMKFLYHEKQHEGSILLNTGDQWKNIRKFISPAFSPSKLKSMTPLIEESVDTFIGIIERNAENRVEFDFYPLSQKLVAEVTLGTAFGIENNIQHNTDNQIFVGINSTMATPINMPLYILVNCFPCLFPLIYRLRKLALFSRKPGVRLCENLAQIVKLRKSITAPCRNDIMQVLIGSTEEKNDQGKIQSLSDAEIVANALHLYAAAYDTTSITMAIVAHHLVNFPEIQEKVRREVQELYENEGKIDFNGVFTGLHYLECVIKETVRQYPPLISFFSRECVQDYKYENMTIPKGSTVMIAVHPIHYDEEYWPNPEIFDPERFSLERKHEIIPFTFQAFGDGPHNCIGMRMAYLEIKLLFAKLLLKYRLECGPNTEIGKLSTTGTFLTVCPKYGVNIKVSKI